MLGEVASFINRRGKEDLIGQLVLVSDRGVDGEFLLHHFLSQALKDGHLVYLVSFTQSFIHYSSVAAKLGVNLSRFQASGQLVYVDCLTRLLDRMWVEPRTETTPTNPAASTFTYSLDSNRSLCGLYKALQSFITEHNQQKQDRPVCLVFNDLSTLVSVGVEVKQVISFVRYCYDMVTMPEEQRVGGGYIIAMVHCEGSDGKSEEDRMRTHLRHHAHLSLHVNGLETGYSRDVHGEVTAEWRDPSPSSSSFYPSMKHAQFKLTDRTVHLFAKGTSKAIL